MGASRRGHLNRSWLSRNDRIAEREHVTVVASAFAVSSKRPARTKAAALRANAPNRVRSVVTSDLLPFFDPVIA